MNLHVYMQLQFQIDAEFDEYLRDSIDYDYLKWLYTRSLELFFTDDYHFDTPSERDDDQNLAEVQTFIRLAKERKRQEMMDEISDYDY